MLVNSLLRLFEISIATSFLILPLCLASRRINRRYGAKWKYYIWLLLAVRLMIPVNLPAVNGFSILPDLSRRQQIQTQEQPIQSQAHTGSQPETVPSQSQEQEQPISEPPYSIDGTKENTEAQPAAIMNVTDIAAIVWCVGFCVFSVFQLYVYYAFRRGIFVDGRECENSSIHELIVSTSHAIGLHRTMPVIVSRKVNSPMILGIFRPVLVIPREDYSSAEFNMIVRHELTHCKRHDIAFKMLLTAVNALHWFNPFVYLMVREANADIELCCDADVLRNADSVQRKAYADSILTSMEREKGFVPVSTCFSNGGINKMKERLENIIDNGRRKTGIVLLALIAILSVLLGMFVSCGENGSNEPFSKSAYINYNNYDSEHREMEYQDNKLYYIVNDINYVDHVVELNNKRRKTICSGVTGRFVKNKNDIYDVDYENNLYRFNLDSGEKTLVFSGIRNGLFLVYHENVIVCDNGKVLLINENNENECLLECKAEWIGATENVVYVVSLDPDSPADRSLVWAINLSARKAELIGTIPQKIDYTFRFAVSNNYLAMTTYYDDSKVLVFNLNTGTCSEYALPHMIISINAGRNDLLYLMCCDEDEYGQAKQSKDSGIYRLDLKDGNSLMIDNHASTSAVLYVFDDDWVYVHSVGWLLFFGTDEFDRVAVDGSKREHLYTASIFNMF